LIAFERVFAGQPSLFWPLSAIGRWGTIDAQFSSFAAPRNDRVVVNEICLLLILK